MQNRQPQRTSADLRLLLCLLLPLCAAAATEPDTVVQDYYAAVAAGDCARAAALRPGYAAAACSRLAAARLLALEVRERSAGRAVLGLSVEVQTRDGATERFDGLVGLRLCGEQWYIPTWAFQGGTDGEFSERFLNGVLDQAGDFCAGVAPVPSAAAGDTAAAAQRLPIAVPPVARYGVATVGSAHVLARCWQTADLAARPGEAAVGLASSSAEPSLALPAGTDRWGGTAQGPFLNVRYVRPADGAGLVALTFNLIERPGEVAGFDVDLVETLRAAGAPATFFASGRWMQSHPERTRQLMADPLFELGSLGWDHRNMVFADAAEAARQWRLADAVYRRLRADLAHRGCTADAEGRRQMARIPALPTLLRFPYGRCDRAALAAAATAGVPIVQWSLVLDDIARDTDIHLFRARVREDLDRLGPGLIVVGHADGRGRHSAAAVRLLLGDLRASGYEPVTVSTLLGAGEPGAYSACFEHQPGDNLSYDDWFPD